MNKNENHYKNHRARMREKFAESGFKGFHDYEVLEFILFFIFPRKDTKPLSKTLVKHFGSFSATFDASIQELAQIPGMGIQSATQLKSLRDALTYYFEDRAIKQKIIFSKQSEILSFLIAELRGKPLETLFVIFLNAKNEVLEFGFFGEGNQTDLLVQTRVIAESALKSGAVSVILSHNHPGGNALPSADDINITRKISQSLSLIEVNLLDHIIISDNDSYSFLGNGLI